MECYAKRVFRSTLEHHNRLWKLSSGEPVGFIQRIFCDLPMSCTRNRTREDYQAAKRDASGLKCEI